MKRRSFIAALGSTAAWPVVARAQQPQRVRRIGVLLPLSADDPDAMAQTEAFLQALAQLGWTDGRLGLTIPETLLATADEVIQ